MGLFLGTYKNHHGDGTVLLILFQSLLEYLIWTQIRKAVNQIYQHHKRISHNYARGSVASLELLIIKDFAP